MLKILRGTSNCGKSTYALQMVEMMGYKTNCIVSSDEYREILFGDRAIQTENDRLFRFVNEIIETRIANRVSLTIFDATNLKIASIKHLIHICEKYGEKFEIVSIHPPELEELIERNRKRCIETGFFVPEEILARHRESYFNSMKNFLDLAKQNPLCTFKEVMQSELGYFECMNESMEA